MNSHTTETALEDPRCGVKSMSLGPSLEDTPAAKTPRLLTDLLHNAAEGCGDRIAVLSGRQRFSYAEVEGYSDRVAGQLLLHGIQPGDRVIIGLPNSAEFIMACFAVWKARAIAVVLDHQIQAASLQGILERVEPAALIAESNFAEKTFAMPELVRSIRAVFLKRDRGPAFEQQHIAPGPLPIIGKNEGRSTRIAGRAQPDDLATITFTSGTTGMPKGVMHTHASILACAAYTQSYLQLSQSDVVMLPLPLSHVLAFRRFLTCFLAQCALIICPNIFIMKQLAEDRPTGLVLVPSACNVLLDNFDASLQIRGECLRYVEIGSEPISVERLNQLKAILPKAKIHLTYGLTEGRVGYLMPGPNGILDRLESSSYGLEIKVVDGNGFPVHAGESGEILISGSGLFHGYWGDPAETQAALKKHGFRTGDMGRVDENGKIQLMGRLDDMLKVGGHKIHPREIEAVLQRHPSVAEAVVAGCSAPAKKTNSALRAFVIPKKGLIVSEKELLAYCREHLELYKVPASICLRESFPRTALGKIQRALIANCRESH